jgi:hypothetical protein
MLGMLGQLFQYYFRLPDAAFQEGAKPGVALAKVRLHTDTLSSFRNMSVRAYQTVFILTGA